LVEMAGLEPASVVGIYACLCIDVASNVATT